MAEIHSLGNPTSSFNAAAIGYLSQMLPERFAIFNNLRLKQGTETFEYDIVVITEGNVFVIELRDYRGKRLLTQGRTWLLDERQIPNPMYQLRNKARALAFRLHEYSDNLRGLFVRPILVIPEWQTEIQHSETDLVFNLEQAAAWIREHGKQTNRLEGDVFVSLVTQALWDAAQLKLYTNRITQDGYEQTDVPMDLDYLTETVIPYFQAIHALDVVIHRIQDLPPPSFEITEIAKTNPISIDVKGIADAFRLVQEVIVPWRYKNARLKAELEAETQKAAILETRSRAMRERSEAEKNLAEAKKQQAETERMEIETRKAALELRLQEAQITLALSLLSKIGVDDMTEVRRIKAVNDMLPALETLTNNELAPPQPSSLQQLE